MSNTSYQDTIVNQYRRGILLSGAAFFAVSFVTSPSLASGGGGGGGECGSCESDEQSNNSKKAPIKSMTQNDFRNLSDREILNHLSNTKIDGFSHKMSKNLLSMAFYDRTSTRRLVKDMAKLKTKKARRARLKKETNRVEKLKALLHKSMENLEKNKASDGARNAELHRFSNADKYLTYVRRWARNPMEGTRK